MCKVLISVFCNAAVLPCQSIPVILYTAFCHRPWSQTRYILSCSFRLSSNLRSIPTWRRFRWYGAIAAAVVGVVVVVVVGGVVVVGAGVGVGEVAEDRERESRESGRGAAFDGPNPPPKRSIRSSAGQLVISAITEALIKKWPTLFEKVDSSMISSHVEPRRHESIGLES